MAIKINISEDDQKCSETCRRLSFELYIGLHRTEFGNRFSILPIVIISC